MLILLSVSVVTAGLEGVLRLQGVEPHSKFPKARTCDGAIGEPNSTYFSKRTSYDDWDRVTISGNGFRDTYNSGNASVLTLGDSYTFGALVGDNETYETYLDRWSPETRFVNLAGSGTSQNQQLYYYRNTASDRNHSTVFLQYYLGNDMRGNTLDQTSRAHYEIREGELQLVHPPQNTTTNHADDFVSGIFGNVLDLAQNTATYSFVLPRIRSVLYRTGIQQSYQPTGEDLQSNLRLTRALLTEMNAEARQHNATLVIATIPERGEINPQNPSRRLQSNAQYYWDAQREMLTELAAQQENVHLITSKEYLADRHAETGEDGYGRIDGHFNEQGQLRFARYVHRRLQTFGIVRETETNRSSGINTRPAVC